MPPKKRIRQRSSQKHKTVVRKGPALAPLQDRLSLKHVRLVELHALLNITRGQIPSPKVNVQVQSNFGANAPEKTILGNLRVTVAPLDETKDGAEAKSAVKIVIGVQCLFGVDEVPTIESLTQTEIQGVNQVITLIAWPYVRQHIASITSSMGLPAFTLPLMRIKVVEMPPGTKTEMDKPE
jgi:preprotein translocase subunit SecB